MLALPFQNLDEIHVPLIKIIKVLDYVLDQKVLARSLVFPVLEMSDNDLDWNMLIVNYIRCTYYESTLND